MFGKALRRAIPAVLALLGAGLLSGCLFIPTFNATIEGKNVAGDVGDANSRKPVRVDRATIEDAYRILGPPEYATPDGRQVAYSWRVLNGYWVGLCTGPQTGSRALVLEFDGEGVLRSFNVLAEDGVWMSKGPRTPPLPPGMQPFATGPVLVPSTQPVTISPGPLPRPLPAPGGPLPPDPVPGRAPGAAPVAPLPPDAVPYRTPGK